jgi:nitroimidazol reductase NimA-like FMN-containing flavoprotein (pyridoxamine 5'-phosphate oxidase superfamily)
MAKINPKLKLSHNEIDALMSAEARLRIATVGPGTRINLTPMTFGWAGGKVYIFGRGQKVTNLRRDGTATVLVDIGEAWRDLQGIMLQGQAEILETAAAEAADEDLAAAQLNIGQKHGIEKDGAPAPYKATAAGNSRRWIVFTPEHIVSWNNKNLPE